MADTKKRVITITSMDSYITPPPAYDVPTTSLKINLSQSSPSIPESLTANTDDEAANISPDLTQNTLNYSPNTPNTPNTPNIDNDYLSDNDSTHSESFSYEESKIEILVKQQEFAKKSSGYEHISRPSNLPPKTPRDDDADEEIFDKLLISCMYFITYNPKKKKTILT